jgi:hypothetical protein
MYIEKDGLVGKTKDPNAPRTAAIASSNRRRSTTLQKQRTLWNEAKCESAVTMLLLPHDTPLWSRCNCKFRGGEVEILAEKFKNVSVGVWAQNQNLIHYQCLIRKAP